MEHIISTAGRWLVFAGGGACGRLSRCGQAAKKKKTAQQDPSRQKKLAGRDLSTLLAPPTRL